jgi:hypothetical protein
MAKTPSFQILKEIRSSLREIGKETIIYITTCKGCQEKIQYIVPYGLMNTIYCYKKSTVSLIISSVSKTTLRDAVFFSIVSLRTSTPKEAIAVKGCLIVVSIRLP